MQMQYGNLLIQKSLGILEIVVCLFDYMQS